MTNLFDNVKNTGVGQTVNGKPVDPLAVPGARAALAARIHADIEAYCEDKYNDGHRNHLGASLIGHECTRYLWNTFRWLYAERFTGRQLRLFQRGHLEEARFQEYLEGIGAKVVEFQPDADGVENKGAKQYRVSDVGGHFGGSLDGQVWLPETYGLPFGLLSEYKTKGTGRGFAQLLEKGVKLTNDTHFVQMCVYGYKYGYKYALYMSVNKNDDDLHVEIVELDEKRAIEAINRASDVINSRAPPEKISQSPAFFKCKMCAYKDICFNDAPVEKNCRSCIHAVPVDNAKWHCELHGEVIPADFIPQGCNKHKPIA